MDHLKTGKLIRELRTAQGLTQSQLASMLFISDRTVSKWERGLGMPDISLLVDLSAILHTNIEQLLSGEKAPEDTTGGNMKKASYYVCPVCGNISVCTGTASVSCCGRNLEAMQPMKAAAEDRLCVEDIDGEWYVTGSHPMEKDHYISFVAFANGGSLSFFKQYPEWELQARFPKRGHGMLLWYCTRDGLQYQLI